MNCFLIKTRPLGLIASKFSNTTITGFRFYGGSTSSARHEPEKSVFISQSSDIHTNLALEDWLYKNFSFDNHRVLLLWKNEPCVVIGRHQNPWQEVDVTLAEEKQLPIARRNSGGGTVYHDKGNLNCTFFSPRKEYDRQANLEIITRAMKRQFGIQAEISPRQDVNLEGYKISGTAAKLGKNAYHHCTVLVDSDLKNLTEVLNPNTEGIDSRATKSIKSPVKNLKSMDKDMSMEKVVSSIGYEYLRTSTDGNDGGQQLIEKQRGFQMINPTNEWFPGLDDIKAELKSWDWTYGKAPDFSVEKIYTVGTSTEVELKLKLNIIKGFIRSASLELPSEQNSFLSPNTFADLSAFISAIKDRPFHMGILTSFEGLLFKTSQNVSNLHFPCKSSIKITSY